jgi:Fic family protein
MQVVSGPIGQEKIHFEAPSADRLDHEMNTFLTWMNSETDLDPLLKAGIAHLWFVTLHPFEDGNGRIGRAIVDMLLARADGVPERFYSVSTQIEAERKEYYLQLEQQQRHSTDITMWLGWFLDCLGRAISTAETPLEQVLFKARIWDQLREHPINERQRLILNKMLEVGFEGHMNTSKYAKLANRLIERDSLKLLG